MKCYISVWGTGTIVMDFISMQAHPPGAVNVQIYRLIKEWTAWDIARRAAFAFFGIFAGTEENPEFIKSRVASYALLFDASSPFICNSNHMQRPHLCRC
jgi:hypothetical protein